MATTKAFHFRAGGGFKATRGFSSSALARKHAQTLAKRLGHVVTYFFTGGVHHKVKPPKANPCKGKKAAGAKRKNPSKSKAGWQVLPTDYSQDRAYSQASLYRSGGWVAKVRKMKSLKAPYQYRVYVKVRAAAKAKKPAKSNKPAGELGDWINVKKAKQVRVRKLKGGVVKLDIKT